MVSREQRRTWARLKWDNRYHITARDRDTLQRRSQWRSRKTSTGRTGAVMTKFRSAIAMAACAVAVVMVVTHVEAQQRGAGAGPDGGPPQRGADRIRHLVYIGTPGDGGTDNQSGVIVLDADKGYSFLKRISYGLPASLTPAPKVAGIEASIPLQMVYVATNGFLLAIDLKTDNVAWRFDGESTP